MVSMTKVGYRFVIEINLMPIVTKIIEFIENTKLVYFRQREKLVNLIKLCVEEIHKQIKKTQEGTKRIQKQVEDYLDKGKSRIEHISSYIKQIQENIPALLELKEEKATLEERIRKLEEEIEALKLQLQLQGKASVLPKKERKRNGNSLTVTYDASSSSLHLTPEINRVISKALETMKQYYNKASLPILDMVKVEIADRLVITGTNIDTGIIVNIPINPPLSKSISFLADKVSLLEAFKQNPTSIVLGDNCITVEAEGKSITLDVDSADDFPLMPEKPPTSFAIDKEFINALKDASNFANEKDVCRPAFTRVLIDENNIASTDGCQFYLKPHQIGSDLSKICSDEGRECGVYFPSSKFMLCPTEIKIIAKLMEIEQDSISLGFTKRKKNEARDTVFFIGQYVTVWVAYEDVGWPKYDSIIDSASRYEVTFETDIDTLKKRLPASEVVTFLPNGNESIVLADEDEKIKAILPCKVYRSFNPIALKVKYVENACKVLEKTVSVRIKNEKNPILIERENTKILIMPIVRE